jgi:hypothetical protein
MELAEASRRNLAADDGVIDCGGGEDYHGSPRQAFARRVQRPAVHTPQRGRESRFKYLAGAAKVRGPGSRYVAARESRKIEGTRSSPTRLLPSRWTETCIDVIFQDWKSRFGFQVSCRQHSGVELFSTVARRIVEDRLVACICVAAR